MNNRILVVEDDPDIRTLVVAVLEQELGAEVITADGGRSIVRQVKDLNPALVLLDMLAPEPHDLEVVSQLRADPSLTGIPVVVMSTVPSRCEHAKAAGCVDFVPKPFDVDYLLAKVRQYLPGGSRPNALVQPPA